MKILYVDRPFPTHIAQWRIEEAKSFVKIGADFLSVGSKEESHKEMADYYGLNDYNIMIFTPKWNHLHQYNKGFDGISGFNNNYPGDYVYSTGTKFDVTKYDIVYSCFYSRWKIFNELYPGLVPQHKQVIHLYPGGEFTEAVVIPHETNIITTQKYYTDCLKRNGNTKVYEVIGASHLQKDSTFIPRTLNTGKLKVCFSSAVKQKGKGVYATLKGGDIYSKAVTEYKREYRKDNIEFISIGHCPSNEYIRNNKIVPMEKLKKIYDTVDIYINPEKGLFQSGWPLGVEACLRGSALISTDPFNARAYHPTFKDKIIIVDVNNVEQIVKHIKRLYEDRVLLNKLSNELQEAMHDFYSYENQQGKIISNIERIHSENNRIS